MDDVTAAFLFILYSKVRTALTSSNETLSGVDREFQVRKFELLVNQQPFSRIRKDFSQDAGDINDNELKEYVATLQNRTRKFCERFVRIHFLRFPAILVKTS